MDTQGTDRALYRRGAYNRDTPDHIREEWDKATMRAYLRWRTQRLRRLTRPDHPTPGHIVRPSWLE